jgi:hypothetical protein
MILVLPASAVPGGLLWREAQLKAGNPTYARIDYQDGTGRMRRESPVRRQSFSSIAEPVYRACLARSSAIRT